MHRFLPAALALVAALAVPARAAPVDIARLTAQCAAESGQGVAPEQRIAACTNLIGSGQLSGDDLALAFARRGDGNLDGGHFTQAIGDYDTAFATYGKKVTAVRSAMLLNARGFAYVNAGRPARAVQDFNGALALDPHMAAAYTGRGDAYFDLQAPARARQDFERAVALQPTLAGGHLGLGVSDYATGDYPRAIMELGYALLLKPDEGKAYYYRGRSYLASGLFDLAEQDFTRSLATVTENGDQIVKVRDEARADKAAWLARLAPVPEASSGAPPGGEGAVLPARAVGRSHDCSTLYPDVARHLFESGDVLVSYDLDENGAIGDVTLLRSSGSPRLDLAGLACVSALWRNTPAVKDGRTIASPGHQAMIRFNVPPVSEATDYYTRATGLLLIGDYDKALADMNRAIALDAKKADFYFERAAIEYYLGQYDRAVADYEQDIALLHGDPAAVDARDLAKSQRDAPALAPPTVKPGSI